MTEKRDEVLKKCDELLAAVAAAAGAVADVQMRAQAALEWAKAEWAEKLAPHQAQLAGAEKQLVACLKKHKAAIFADRDREDLTAGAVLHQVADRVKKAKGVLEALQRLQWRDGLRVVEEVDWTALADWPLERLIAVGTEKKKTEKYSYELYAKQDKNADHPGADPKD